MSAEPEMSSTGLHAAEDRTPGELIGADDPLAQASKARQAREAVIRCGGNKVHAARYLNVNVKTLEKWLGKPLTGNNRLRLLRVQIEAVVDEILAGIPLKVKEASLTDSVKALKDLTPILKDLSAATASKDKKVADVDRVLRERAKDRLKLVKLKADHKQKKADAKEAEEIND